MSSDQFSEKPGNQPAPRDDEQTVTPDIRLRSPAEEQPARVVLAILTLVLLFFFAIGNPGLVYVVLIVVVPAILRTIVIRRRRRQLGELPEVAPRWSLLLASIGSIAIVGIAAGITFCAVCTAVNFGAELFVSPPPGLLPQQPFSFPFLNMAVTLGTITAAVVALWFLIRIFREKT